MVSDGLPPPVSSGEVGISALRFAANELLFTCPFLDRCDELDRISLSISGCPPPEARLDPDSETSLVAPVSKVDEPWDALMRPISALEAAVICEALDCALSCVGVDEPAN